MLAPFLRDAPVCESGSSHAGASAEPGHSPSSRNSTGGGAAALLWKRKMKGSGRTRLGFLGCSGGSALCPVACTECQGCVCPCAGEQGLPKGGHRGWVLQEPPWLWLGTPSAASPSPIVSPGLPLKPSLSCLCRGCALPDGRGAQADPEPAGGDGECPAQHPCQWKMLFCALPRRHQPL